MKAKKSITLLLALLLLLTAAGCAGQTAAGEKQPAAAAAEESPAPTAEPEPTPEPTPTPTPLRQLPKPPDVDITSWEFLYAGPHCGVGRYHPTVAVVDGQYMDARCRDATAAFLQAARSEGYTVYIGVGYRNFEYTIFHYEKAMREYGSSYEAAKHVFAAGCSEHSTGLAFDITDEQLYWANYYDMHDETVADTEVYQWMCEHCAEYGFIVRYPEGREQVYGMACYPGHFRYVGKEAAQYIMDNGLCLEDFLSLYGVRYAGIEYEDFEIAE